MRVSSILPVLFLVGSGCAANVKLAWDQNPATENVTGYNVYRSKSSGGGYAKLNPKPVTTPFYQDTITYNGKTYYYVVRAVKGSEEGTESNEVAYEAIPSILKFPVRLSSKRVLDLILVLLGPRWHEAAAVFRLLTPTFMVLALFHPLGWLLMATGRAGRSLSISLLIAPVVILGYLFGLKQGPEGVAAGYSTAMALLVVPVVLWSRYGTSITTKDLLNGAMHPFLSIVVGAAATVAVRGIVGQLQSAPLRLVIDIAVLFGVYLIMLLFVMEQKSVYSSLLRNAGLWHLGSRRTEEHGSTKPSLQADDSIDPGKTVKI